MSSETRTVRPFNVDRRFGSVFADAVLYYGSQQCEVGGSISVGDDFDRCQASLVWTASGAHRDFVGRIREGVLGSGLKLEDCRVVVVARLGYLKMREVVFSHALADPSALVPETQLDLDDRGRRRAVFRSRSHGVEVDAYVALARTVPAAEHEPLRPWRAGTWLAHGRFVVRCREYAELFRPSPLNEQAREQLQLSAGTMTFAEFVGDMSDPEAQVDDVVTYWVDEELLQTIDAQRRSPAAELVQRWLFTEFVGAVIYEYARSAAEQPGARDHSYEDVKDSVIGRIVAALAGRGSTVDKRTEALRVFQRQPHVAIAGAQDTLRLLSPALRAVKEGST